jgi:hypothetical protein
LPECRRCGVADILRGRLEGVGSRSCPPGVEAGPVSTEGRWRAVEGRPMAMARIAVRVVEVGAPANARGEGIAG